MSKNHVDKRKAVLEPRRLPVQQRAVVKTQQILDITALLLKDVGIEGLTTVLIAKQLGISVGSLYHYFPNKRAILYALGARWLEEITLALEGIERLPLHAMDLPGFVDEAVERMLAVYKKQRAILPLAQALWSIPELRSLDIEHDKFFIARMTGVFERLGFDCNQEELKRLGRAYLETIHAMLLVIVGQKKILAQRSLDDLKRMVLVLLEPCFSVGRE